MARTSGGMMTAQATTGPAIGPLPTSSTPARSGPFSRRRSRSMVVQRLRRGTSRRRVLGIGVVDSEIGFVGSESEAAALAADWGLPGSTSSFTRSYASRREVGELRLDPSLRSRLSYGLRARHGDFGFALSDARRLAG